jgi:ketosteroid isomerase-like protein
MSTHPNQARIQQGWDAIANGDPGPAFNTMANDIVMENGPLPVTPRWRIARGKEEIAVTMMEDAALLGSNFRQSGQCIYADDRIAISLVHDEAELSTGRRYDARPIAIMRFNESSLVDRLWIVEPDEDEVAALLSGASESPIG